MNAQQAMDEVLDAVAKATDKPALLHPDSSIGVPATVKIARGDAPAHVIIYRPDMKNELPYLVCFQAGFILRLFQAPPDSRFDLAGNPSGKTEANRLLDEHFRRQKKMLPPQVSTQFVERMFNGLLLQLRSMPVGMRIDAWIFQNYPALREHQRTMAIRQLNENVGALTPEVKSFSPRRIYEANVSMSAAFAAFWARLFADDLFVTPYQTSGHLAKGEALLKIFDDMPNDPAQDRSLIDAWGAALSLQGWYLLVSRGG